NITDGYNDIGQVNEDFFKEDSEKKLYELYKDINFKVNNSLLLKDYSSVIRNLLEFSIPLENFFTKVLVMDKEPYKTNRIALLKTLRELFFKFADFSKLVIQK
ncbi:MAG: glycine--tRNA ligase subunit beta, partial [Candidatus Firestonebacteria bacterium]|nr:glycine--tRNA ligase subunit beta [Candidatus Firestonebacteria bacterium]